MDRLTAIRIWLAWQMTIMSLLITGAFFAIRIGIQTQRMKQDVAFLKALALTLVAHWGRASEEMKAALDKCVATFGVNR